MSLESTLERIATALETIASNGGLATPAEPKPAGKRAAAAAAAAAAPATAPAAAPAAAPAEPAAAAGPTTADAQKLVSTFLQKGHKELMRGILQRFQATKASEVKAKDLQAFVDEATEALAAVG